MEPTDQRVVALERRVDRLEPAITAMERELAAVRSDVTNMVEGAGRIAGSVEKLTDKMTEKLIADGASSAVVASELKHIKDSMADLKTERAARAWPPAAKAAVIVAAFAAAAQLGSTVL